MLQILLMGKDSEGLADFFAALGKTAGIRLNRVASGEKGRELLESRQVDVVVMDEQLSDGDSMAFVRELIKEQPLINWAIVSSLAPEDFHEATEGLGVFMQLPVHPGPVEAEKMLQLLHSIGALMAQ